MKLLTWNIQWGLGCDGNVDLRENRRHRKGLLRRGCFLLSGGLVRLPGSGSGGGSTGSACRFAPRLYADLQARRRDHIIEWGAAVIRQHDPFTIARSASDEPHAAVAGGRGEDDATPRARSGRGDVLRTRERHHLSPRISRCGTSCGADTRAAASARRSHQARPSRVSRQHVRTLQDGRAGCRRHRLRRFQF